MQNGMLKSKDFIKNTKFKLEIIFFKLVLFLVERLFIRKKPFFSYMIYQHLLFYKRIEK
jgi:hypothetical protein